MEDALTEMVELIIYIGKYFDIFNVPDPNKITINFDDSIIESNATKREQDRLDVQMGAMSLEEYRMKWYSEDEQTAKSKISNINTRINIFEQICSLKRTTHAYQNTLIKLYQIIKLIQDLTF